ncbi:MAG: RNA 3'-terminal phosphate cyclase [bacterium]
MNEIIDIDGSLKSGSGTIVRHCLSLSSILRRELRMRNIRARRKKPGLRPQHLKAVEACCLLTGGTTERAAVGSSEIVYTPGEVIRHGEFNWDIGTAGSTTMMALCLLPLGCFAAQKSYYTISGGVFQDFAPNAFHTGNVLLPLLKRCGIAADLRVIQPGYVPLGGGTIRLEVEPVTGRLKPMRLSRQGRITGINGIAVASHLTERRVSRRMADACVKELRASGYHAEITIIEDDTSNQPGAGLFISAKTDTGCIIGADMAGKIGRSAEHIGASVARALLEDIRSGATVDRHTADQLILYAGLAEGESEYVIPAMNDHIDANLWLVEHILGARVSVRQGRISIRGIGFERSS